MYMCVVYMCLCICVCVFVCPSLKPGLTLDIRCSRPPSAIITAHMIALMVSNTITITTTIIQALHLITLLMVRKTIRIVIWLLP